MSLGYYQDMLKLFWTGIKRSKMYEDDLMHSINCICCSKILPTGNDNETEKLRSKMKMTLDRKPGGHNRK